MYEHGAKVDGALGSRSIHTFPHYATVSDDLSFAPPALLGLVDVGSTYIVLPAPAASPSSGSESYG